MNYLENKNQLYQWLTSRNPPLKKDSLEPIFNLLNKLDNPENKLKNIIHITGTNGKTSTSKYVQSALTKAGFKTGLFISPYIEKFNERIQIDNQYITDQELVKIANQIYPLIEDQSQFEILVAIMLVYFAKNNLDYAVIEVGIGGLFDSTNVFEIPKIVGITNVSYDHQDILGNTIEEIAKQKAGIITEESQVILGPNFDQSALAIVEKISKEKKATVFLSETNQNSSYQDWNLATAQKIVDLAILEPSKRLIDNSTKIAGRLEYFQFKNHLILIDGAHNQAGIEAFFNYLDQNFDKQIQIFFSALQAKQSIDFLPFDRYPNIEVVNFEFNKPTVAGKNWLAEFDRILEVNNHQPIVFTGSLYFISQVRNYLLENDAKKNPDN